MRRLTKSAVAPVRNAHLKKNNMLCDLCKEEIKEPATDAVLDHCHKSGQCRGVLHRGCNAALGKVENARNINALADPERFKAWCEGLYTYIYESRMDCIYPTHRTEEEKKATVNRRRRNKRRAEKLQQIKESKNEKT